MDSIDQKCGEIFVSNTSVYIFVCWYCKKQFSRFSSFQNHNEALHNEEHDTNEDIFTIRIKDEFLIEEDGENKIYEQIQIEKYEAGFEKELDDLDEYGWLNEQYITEDNQNKTNGETEFSEENSVQFHRKIKKACLDFVNHNKDIPSEKILILSNDDSEDFVSQKQRDLIDVQFQMKKSSSEDSFSSDNNTNHVLLAEEEIEDEQEIFHSDNESETKDYIHKKKIFCEFCKYQFKISQNHDKQKCELVQEVIKNHNYNYDSLQYEGIYLCKECPRYFEKLEKLTFHSRSHYNNGTCQICDRNFMRLDRHMKSQHASEKSEEIKKISNIKLNCSESLQCSLCEKKFKLQIHLRKHELNHQNLNCRYCMKNFKAPILLRNHIRTHTGEKPFQCSQCTAAFALKRNLSTHIIYKHTDDKPFDCRFEGGCGKTFKTEHLRNNHEKRHSRKPEFQCEICGMDFNVKAKLRMHYKKKHMAYSQRPHHCSFCDKKFVEKEQLREHERTHTGEKPLKCNQCSSSFAKKSSLREHKKLHSGEKKHVCKICGKAFAQLAGYSNHMKNHP